MSPDVVSNYSERDLRRVDQVAMVLTAIGVVSGLCAALDIGSTLHQSLFAVGFLGLGGAMTVKLRQLRQAGGREPEELR